jgi:uncharacterized protein (DUF1499 family)/TM2 domain-containing membrane protein YozV
MRSLQLALAALALFVVGPLLARFGIAKPLHGFLVFVLSGAFALLAILSGLWLGLAKGQKQAFVGIVLALVPLAVLGKGVLAGGKVPRINDITTDLDDPPVFVAAGKAEDNAGKDMAYPADFKEQVRAGYPDLGPLTLPLPPASVFQKLELTIAAQPGWTITHKDAAAGLIEAEVTGGMFRFVDDIVVRVRPEGTGARVDARSRSRVGKGDFGANAERIKALLATIR